MKYYISGKVTGTDMDATRKRFEDAALWLNHRGHESIIPLDLNHRMQSDWIDYMVVDIEALLRNAEGLFMLDGWGESRGARIEYAIAREMGLNVTFQSCNDAISEAEPKKILVIKAVECIRCGKKFLDGRKGISKSLCDECAVF